MVVYDWYFAHIYFMMHVDDVNRLHVVDILYIVSV